MQQNIYSSQEDCEMKTSSNDRDKCSTNKEIIDSITTNADASFCELCSSLKLKSDINMCTVVSNLWKTLNIVR